MRRIIVCYLCELFICDGVPQDTGDVAPDVAFRALIQATLRIFPRVLVGGTCFPTPALELPLIRSIGLSFPLASRSLLRFAAANPLPHFTIVLLLLRLYGDRN